jgi:hypothetical protein
MNGFDGRYFKMTLLTKNIISTPLYDFKYYSYTMYGTDTSPVYGLYEPVGGCFLIILKNEIIAQELKNILSSRYNLYICRLDTASNYTLSQINNANCNNWSLVNKNDITFIVPFNPEHILVKELCWTTETPKYNTFNETAWCLFCAYWIAILNNPSEHDRSLKFYGATDSYLNSFLNVSEVNGIHATVLDLQPVRKDILKLLYLGRDFKETELAIQKMVDFQ